MIRQFTSRSYSQKAITATAERRASATIPIKRVARRDCASPRIHPISIEALDGIHLCFVLDASTSMFRQGSDPQGVRYAALRSLVDLLASSHSTYLSVIQFGSTVDSDGVLRPCMVSTSRRAIDRCLGRAVDLGGTRLDLALSHVPEIIASGDAATRTNVIVVTDGAEVAHLPLQACMARIQAPTHLLIFDPLKISDETLMSDQIGFTSISRLKPDGGTDMQVYSFVQTVLRTVGVQAEPMPTNLYYL